MTTDYRTLCAELADALAIGEPQMPHPFIVKHYSSDERPTIKGNGFDGLEIGENREEAEEFVAWVNARLAELKKACPAIEPVPVSERLPGPEDCDEEGQCWWYHPETFDLVASWCHSRGNGAERYWLPHHALPVPTPSSEEI